MHCFGKEVALKPSLNLSAVCALKYLVGSLPVLFDLIPWGHQLIHVQSMCAIGSSRRVLFVSLGYTTRRSLRRSNFATLLPVRRLPSRARCSSS